MSNPNPPTSNVQNLSERVSSFPFWYHRIELPGGIITPGGAPINSIEYDIPKSLEGLRVLDVGAWDGFWSFEALKRGAKQVVAIDDFSDNVGMLADGSRKAWQTFDLCREALGYSQDRCDRIEMSVYEVSAARLGLFDVVFFFGTLYHLRHPLLALDLLSSVCTRQICVESAILDDYSPYRGGLNNGYPGRQSVAEFYPTNEYGNNFSNWWVPTLVCMGQMISAAGFRQVNVWRPREVPTHVFQCRGFAHGIKKNEADMSSDQGSP